LRDCVFFREAISHILGVYENAINEDFKDSILRWDQRQRANPVLVRLQ